MSSNPTPYITNITLSTCKLQNKETPKNRKLQQQHVKTCSSSTYEYPVTSPDWIGKAYESTHGAYGTVWFATLQNRVELSSPESVIPIDHSSPRCGVFVWSPLQHGVARTGGKGSPPRQGTAHLLFPQVGKAPLPDKAQPASFLHRRGQ